VRLEVARIDPQGKVSFPSGATPAVPLEGPPTLEWGAFVESPRARVRQDQSWEVAEEGRPPRTWQVVGAESVNGVPCVKLTGLQQSEDWDRPRADRTAWRRRDTVWLAPRVGLAYRVERAIEQREPLRQDPGQRSVIRYELESTPVFPGQLFDERRREVQRAREFTESAEPLLREPGKYGPQLEALSAKVLKYLDQSPPTPYREAVLQVRRRVEAARRGELPPVEDREPAASPPVAAVGKAAPDFVVTDLTRREESARLRRYLGRPVLMVFYSPASATVEEVLRFAQGLNDAGRSGATVLALAVSDDAERVLKQRAALKLTFPILSGSALRQTYAVEATPKLLLLDAEGIVRGSYEGWGRETPGAVTEELKHWLTLEERQK
jgi:peroxiredoxin